MTTKKNFNLSFSRISVATDSCCGITETRPGGPRDHEEEKQIELAWPSARSPRT